MFFFFSKTAGYLAQPLVIVSILFLAGLLLKNQKSKKILLITSFILLMVFSNHFLAYTFMRWWEVRPIPFSEVNGVYDYGILLTGITKGKAGPTDRIYFGRSADRAIHTMQLYKLGLIRQVIISGGSGRIMNDSLREADELTPFMVLTGVSRSDIVLENQAKNTHESAVEVAKLMKQMDGPRRLLLITSGYHLRRAKACFQKAGLEVDIFSTEPLAPTPNFSLDMFIVPSVDAFAMWQSLIKEWAGMVVYKMAGYI